MSGEDALRSAYPAILALTYERAEELGGSDLERQLEWLNLAHDLHRQRRRSLRNRNRGLVFEGWPYQQNPFSDMNFERPLPPTFTPVMQTQAEMTFNGNMWFGIGVWGLAEDYYKTAVRLCIVSNDIPAALQNGANLALSYLAGGDWQAALRLCIHLINASIDYPDDPAASNVFQQASTILRWCYIRTDEEHFAAQHTAWLHEVAPGLVPLDSYVFETVKDVWEAIGDQETLKDWAEEWHELERLARVFENPDPDRSFEERWGAPPQAKLELLLPSQRRPRPEDYMGQLMSPSEQSVLLERRAWASVGRHVHGYGRTAADRFVAGLPEGHPLSSQQLQDIKSIIAHSFFTGFRLFVSVLALNGLDVAFRTELDLGPLRDALQKDQSRCAHLFHTYDVSEAITALGEDIFLSRYYREEMDTLPFRYPYSVRVKILDSIYEAYMLCMLAGVAHRGTEQDAASFPPEYQFQRTRAGERDVTEERASSESVTNPGIGMPEGSTRDPVGRHAADRSAPTRPGSSSAHSESSGWWYRPPKSDTHRYGSGEEITARVVGVTYENRQAVIARLSSGETIHLRRETDNPHDKNAIRVERSDGKQIGYISRDLAGVLAPRFDKHGDVVTGRVTELVGSDEPGWNLGVRIAFTVPHPSPAEDEIEF